MRHLTQSLSQGLLFSKKQWRIKSAHVTTVFRPESVVVGDFYAAQAGYLSDKVWRSVVGKEDCYYNLLLSVNVVSAAAAAVVRHALGHRISEKCDFAGVFNGANPGGA
jgi:hypothetical protein